MPILGTIASSKPGTVTYATGNFVSLQTINGTGSSGTLTFSAIPQTFKHLRIFAIHKGTATGTNTQGMYTIQFNSDTGNNYNGTQQVSSGVSTINDSLVTGTNAIFGSSSHYYNTFCSATNTGSAMGVSVIDIPHYTNTSYYKTIASFDGHEMGNNDGNSRLLQCAGSWNNTAAVTSISFKIYDENFTATNFTSTTQFALYGIKG